MKKIFSVLLAVIMMFSVVSCLSVGALSGSTADEVTNSDDNMITGEYELGAVLVSLKKDSPSVETLLTDFVITESRLIMQSSSGDSIYYVKFAEETEEIVWKAIAVLNESPYVIVAEPNYFAYVDPVEPSTTEAPTQAVSVAQPTTEITATTSADLKSSTSDTAETKTPATSDTATTKNSNGVVQTGQSNLVILLTLLLVISVAMVAVFMKSRYRD